MTDGWDLKIPTPPPVEQRPPYSASDYPLGTQAVGPDGVVWMTVYDEQDRRPMWAKSQATPAPTVQDALGGVAPAVPGEYDSLLPEGPYEEDE